jgi:serine/threonine protein kinase
MTERTLTNFHLIKPLGDGTFGVGWAAVNNETGENVCVKVFKNLNEETEKSFETEIEFAQKVDHPNVLKTLGAGRDTIVKNGVPQDEDSYYIVSELAANGEAFDYVSDAGGLKPPQAR